MPPRPRLAKSATTLPCGSSRALPRWEERRAAAGGALARVLLPVLQTGLLPLLWCPQVMVTNVTSLLKTVKAVEDEATKGTRALEATTEHIRQELAVSARLAQRVWGWRAASGETKHAPPTHSHSVSSPPPDSCACCVESPLAHLFPPGHVTPTLFVTPHFLWPLSCHIQGSLPSLHLLQHLLHFQNSGPPNKQASLWKPFFLWSL